MGVETPSEVPGTWPEPSETEHVPETDHHEQPSSQEVPSADSTTDPKTETKQSLDETASATVEAPPATTTASTTDSTAKSTTESTSDAAISLDTTTSSPSTSTSISTSAPVPESEHKTVPDPPPSVHSASHVQTSTALRSILTSDKASSATELSEISTVEDEPRSAVSAPGPLRRLPSTLSSESVPDSDLSTLPDPRKRIHSSDGKEDEVTALSTKLIDAINHQSSLDDTLSKTRMELEAAREKIKELEATQERHREFLGGGVWVRKSTFEQERAQYLNKIHDEKQLRQEAEEGKKKIEQELENLTAELFQQANKMVTDAKEAALAEQVAAAKRYDNLKSQLVDTEGLLKSQQEQLAELKQVMEAMITEERRDDQTTLTTPTSQGFDDSDSSGESDTNGAEFKEIEAYGSVKTDNLDVDSTRAPSGRASPTPAGTPAPALNSPAPPSTSFEPPTPSNPMSFPQLIRPILRDDISAYGEFIDMVRASQIQALMQQQYNAQQHIRSPSSTSLPKTPPIGSSSWTSSTPNATPSAPSVASMASAMTSLSSSSPQPHAKDLKDYKFYKRVLVEDIESTLRLDTAPGISWLVRRSIMAAMVEGTLVAEPVPTNTDNAAYVMQSACSLCGENRRQEPYVRRHRFRLTESDKSTPYPLCSYCLGRVRSVCDFLVFLRMIKDGYWRADDQEAEHAAWEESVRLREQMFWTRIGGGVVPAALSGQGFPSGIASGRHSRIASGVQSIPPTTNGTSNNMQNGEANGDTKGAKPASEKATNGDAAASSETTSGLGILTEKAGTTAPPAVTSEKKAGSSILSSMTGIVSGVTHAI